MGRFRTNAVTLPFLPVLGLTFLGATASPTERERFTVVLHLTDFASTESGQLGRARVELNRIFNHLGVRVVVVDIGEGPQARSCDGVNLFVSLLSPFLVGEHTKRGVADIALGAAMTEAGHAFIYTNRVSGLASQRGIDEGMLLGRVIAHEVGHLLLLGTRHSPSGLMAATIDTDPLGMQAKFRWNESQAIRARLKSNQGNRSEPTTTCRDAAIADR